VSTRPARRYYADDARDGAGAEGGGQVQYYAVAVLLAILVVLLRIVLLGAH
jgi:hypothetical protein